jgi:O-methyltransferase involved in polyketide biosynthesis
VVLNLAAGLDVRPYRMALPSSLRWVELDLPGILDYKEEILGDEKPVCALERVRMDLSDLNARRDLFQKIGASARKVLILSEGLMIYLTDETAGALARDLAAAPNFRYWMMELASPGLLRIIRKESAAQLAESGTSMQFAPKEGPAFFEPFGWKPVHVSSFLKTAARLNRLSLGMRILSMLPESNGAQGSRPWSGFCVFEKQ